MRGPLPDPDALRRNAPTIQPTALPSNGRSGPVPKVPAHLSLGKAGRAWWRWAWSTPQSAAWSDGDLMFVARRAVIEDDLAALGRLNSLDAFAILEADESGDGGEVKRLLGALAGLASNRLAVHKTATDMDDRLGLTPKGCAALRWKIDTTSAPAAADVPDELEGKRANRRESLTG